MSTEHPSHDNVARLAAELWNAQGRPEGRDLEFWLKAEQQLRDPAATNSPGRETESAPLAERVKDETAAESVSEYLMPASTPKQEAIRAAVQTQNPRPSKEPDHTARPGSFKSPPGKSKRR